MTEIVDYCQSHFAVPSSWSQWPHNIYAMEWWTDAIISLQQVFYERKVKYLMK